MSGLIIRHGSPKWWLSPDIWVAQPGTGGATVVASPVQGQTYDVWVRVTNSTDAPISTTELPWLLQVIWAIPTGGPIPFSALPPGNILDSAGIIPQIGAHGSREIQCPTPWTPSFENHGHECLIAWTNASNIAYPLASDPVLDGNAGPGDNWSIAQHNLGVLQVAPSHGRRFQYPFQICNGSREEQSFVVAARQAALAEIEQFLPGVPGGRKVLTRPGKVEHLGIVASADAGASELERAPSEVTVKIAAMSCRRFMLSGVLPEGNALIHITQSRDQRVVGGLSVLAMAEEKK
jgi:hypothetical protein